MMSAGDCGDDVVPGIPESLSLRGAKISRGSLRIIEVLENRVAQREVGGGLSWFPFLSSQKTSFF